MHEQQLGVGRKMGCTTAPLQRSVAEIDSDDDFPECAVIFPPAKTLDDAATASERHRARHWWVGADAYAPTRLPTSLRSGELTCCVAYDRAMNSRANESAEFRSVHGRSRRAIGRKPSAIHS